jgi:5-methyltetrahydrofolate--homocysteine methyltransferase
MARIDNETRAILAKALREGDEQQSEAIAKALVSDGLDPLAIIQKVLVPTLSEVGVRFQNFEIYLPELMMAGEAAKRVTAVVEAATLASGQKTTSLGTVVLGQAEGDLHDIGRNIVATLLSSHGFKVVNLGRDVAASAFLDAAQKENADIVALSALMTTTLPAQRRTIRLFNETGQREKFKIIIGGGAASKAWAAEIGSDGFAPDAASAVDLCKSLIGS